MLVLLILLLILFGYGSLAFSPLLWIVVIVILAYALSGSRRL